MLRRLEKRILVGLPTRDAREAMFRQHLPPSIPFNGDGSVQLECQIEYGTLADATDGYSGSDLKLVCKEAAMRSVRKIFDLLETATPEDTSASLSQRLQLDQVTTVDVMAALETTKPSARLLQDRYTSWQNEYGSS